MAFTVTGLISILVTAGLIVGVPVVLGVVGLAEEWAHLAPLRWPILGVVYVAALTVIYRFGPCRAQARWRWLTPGAIFAALLSVVLSLVFSWFLQTFRADGILWPAGGDDGLPAVDLAERADHHHGRRAQRRDRAPDGDRHHHRRSPARSASGARSWPTASGRNAARRRPWPLR
jgi:hypothetical protein